VHKAGIEMVQKQGIVFYLSDSTCGFEGALVLPMSALVLQNFRTTDASM
jgi:hypothetical protein